jgi:hypothetical protein
MYISSKNSTETTENEDEIGHGEELGEHTSNPILIRRLDLGKYNLRNERSKHDHPKRDC